MIEVIMPWMPLIILAIIYLTFGFTILWIWKRNSDVSIRYQLEKRIERQGKRIANRFNPPLNKTDLFVIGCIPLYVKDIYLILKAVL